MIDNLQEIFDKTAKHLIKQKVASVSMPDAMCAYRDPNGNKCAVGKWIKKKHYNEFMEGSTIDCEEVQEALTKSRVNAKNEKVLDLLTKLQEAHDESYQESICAVSPSKYLPTLKKALIKVGESFKLKTKVIK